MNNTRQIANAIFEAIDTAEMRKHFPKLQTVGYTTNTSIITIHTKSKEYILKVERVP